MALLALWNPNIQFLKTDGTINAGGKIIVTDHNDAESIPANYSDADGTTLNSSPIVLDALGRATCYIDDGSTYDLYVKDANGATLWTVPEMTPGTETIVVRGGFSVSSNDRSVAVTISVDSDGVTNYDLSIQNEIDRATEAEKGLADAIEAEKKRAEGVESTLSGSIAGETERAIAAEKASRTEIVAGDNIKVDKTTGEDGHDIYTINGEKGEYTHIDAATANPLMDGTAAVGVSVKYAREDHVHPTDTSKEDKENKTTVVIGTSNSKYPTDKAVADFVNSSIATNTANYISNNGEPFTSVEQLEAYSGTVTNNDYAFVTGTDSDGNTYYDRYKATVNDSSVTWALEYRLNNSSFTAAQWSAINSGITSALVAKIHDHSNKDVLDGITYDKVNSWDGKQDALTFDTTPTAGSTNPVTSGGIKTALDLKANSSSLNNYVKKYQSRDDRYHVKEGEYYSFVCSTPIGPWNRIQAEIFCLNGAESNIGKFNMFLCLETNDPSLQTAERVASLGGIVWDYNYRGYSRQRYRIYVAKSGNFFYFYAKRNVNSNLEITSFHSSILFKTKSEMTDDISADLDDATWQKLSLVEMTNVYTSTTQERLNSHTGNNTVHITEDERTAWNAKQAALTFDATPTASSTNPVTSGGIKTAIDGVQSTLQTNIDDVGAKGIVINKIDGENVICFE